MNNCNDIEPLLTSYVLGDLDPARAEDVRKHLETCSDCRAAVQELELTLDLLRPALAVDSSTAPAHLDAQHRERVKNWRVPGFLVWLTDRPHPFLQAAAAAACLALIVAIFVPKLSGRQQQAKMAAARADEANRQLAAKLAELEPAAKPPMQVAMVDKLETDRGGLESYRKNTPRAKAPEVHGAEEAVRSMSDMFASSPAPVDPNAPAPMVVGGTAISAMTETAPAEIDEGTIGQLAFAGDKKNSEGAPGSSSSDSLEFAYNYKELGKDDSGIVGTGSEGHEYAQRRRLVAQKAKAGEVDFLAATSSASEPQLLARNEDRSDADALNGPADTESALAMNGLYDGRSAGGRGGALEKTSEDAPAKPVFRAYGSNPYIEVSSNRFSTFSIDVDTASYTLARKYMVNGTLPPPDAVRTEEFVNFFNYGYARPDKDVFMITAEAAPSAFGSGQLLKIGVVGRNVSARGLHQAILTLVIDTSGSMETPDRLGLARQAVRLLLDQLGPNDRVAIVQYGSHASLVLEHTPVSEKEKILAALDGLQTSGSTHLEEGLTLGYNVAARSFKNGAINRVLFFSDGVANLGSANAEDILSEVAGAREKGILCSVFGFGTGTYDDTMLETLANKGDGTYQFIDSLNEAKRIFVDQLSATLDVVATDVKIQVEFNPARVARFRQLGYENRQLKTEDFRNDAVDAGEVGGSQAVTALYEFQSDSAIEEIAPLGTVRVRYRDAISGHVAEIEKKILPSDLRPQFEAADARFKLAACIAEFAEILRGSPFADGSTFEDVAKVLRPVALELNNDPQVQELLSLVHSASSLPRASE